jgi:hypothetical protein
LRFRFSLLGTPLWFLLAHFDDEALLSHVLDQLVRVGLGGCRFLASFFMLLQISLPLHGFRWAGQSRYCLLVLLVHLGLELLSQPSVVLFYFAETLRVDRLHSGKRLLLLLRLMVLLLGLWQLMMVLLGLNVLRVLIRVLMLLVVMQMSVTLMMMDLLVMLGRLLAMLVQK